MSNADQQPRGRSRRPSSDGRSRQSSCDPYRASPTHEKPHKIGSKRSFSISNRESKLAEGAHDRREHAHAEPHSEKRYRASGWPLTNTSPPSARTSKPPSASNRYRRTSSPPVSRDGRSSSQIRASRFVEGSMNDRVSAMPPRSYMHSGDEFLDTYESGRGGRKFATPRRRANAGDKTSIAEQSDTSRHSSIFRFGRTIASSFNPSNWKLFSKNAEIEDEETAEQKAKRKQKEDAERIYQELKASGHFPFMRQGHNSYAAPLEAPNPPVNKHDSGVEFDGSTRPRVSVEERATKDDKRKGRVFLEAPFTHSASPASEYPSSAGETNCKTPKKRPSFILKRPSLSNMKKSFQREAGTPATSFKRQSLSNIKQALGSESGTPDHSARRMPSRRELQKQQKLVKRVSNLESKLEIARRQLTESLGAAPPEPFPERRDSLFPPPAVTRHRFVPGGMPSLPSERLLPGYVPPEEDEIGQAVSTDALMRNGSHMSSAKTDEPQAKVSRWLNKPLPHTGATPIQDRAIASVEDHSMSGMESSAPPSANAVSSERSGFSVANEDGSDREATPKTKPFNAAHPTNKKGHKTAFAGYAYDGGSYAPSRSTQSYSEASSIGTPDIESEEEDNRRSAPLLKAGKHTITLTTPKNNKLQKGNVRSSKTQPIPRHPISTPSSQIDLDPHNQRSSATRFHDPASKDAKQNSRDITPGVFAKEKMKKSIASPPRLTPEPESMTNYMDDSFVRGDSASPLPDTSNASLIYMKPSAAASKVHVSEEVDEFGRPPMPKLPSSVRLPSGEVIKTRNVRGKINKSSKETREEKVNKKRISKLMGQYEGMLPDESSASLKAMQRAIDREDSGLPEKSFQWPDDVF